MGQPERQEIAPGIILEKIQERVKRKKQLVLKLEVQIFNSIEIVVDFEGSENVKLKGKDKSLEIKTIVQPFKKTQIARLKLEKGWTLKTNFKINKLLPSLELQKQYLEEVFEKQKNELNEVKLLETKCMNNSNLEMVFNYLKQREAKFVDFDFKPSYESLGIEEDNFIDIHNCYCHWRRLKFIYLNMNEVNKVQAIPYVYKKEVTPTDLKLGKINFSWLLSAIACIAEKPFLIKRIIKTKDSNDYGIFKVKLCHNGLWQEIILDDFFPCYPFGDPIFDSNIEEDFWVLLLEKAFAKMHGNYALLTEGNCLQGLFDMTNCPTFEINFDQIDTDTLWSNIKKWLKYEYLLCAMTKEIDDQGDFVGTSKELTYSIKRIFEDDKLRLIQLRNLWGIFDWRGEWSKKSKTWSEEMTKKVQPDLEDDTHFWMDFNHFIKNFVKMYVCYTRSWHEIKIKGKFVKSTEETNPNVKNWCSKWGYEIDIVEQTKVIFGIHQKDERDLGAKYGYFKERRQKL